MKKTFILNWLFVWLLTFAVSLVFVTLLFTLGLILIEFLLYPLALGIGALLTGLMAVWAGNRLVNDGLQSPVEAVVLRSVGTAVILALLLIAVQALDLLSIPVIYFSVVTGLVLSIVAAYSASQLRQPPVSDPGQTRRVVTWLVVALAAIPIVIFLASLVGWAGA